MHSTINKVIIISNVNNDKTAAIPHIINTKISLTLFFLLIETYTPYPFIYNHLSLILSNVY